MLLITIWQFDVGILYFKGVIPKHIILFLFKLFRMGPTFSVPLVFYVGYIILKDQPTMIKDSGILTKLSRVLFNKTFFIILCVWSGLVYIINWTKLGIQGLRVSDVTFSSIHFFPVYGPLAAIYIIHMATFVIFIFLVFIFSKKIHNVNFQNFLRSFCFSSLWLIIPGFLNFSPRTAVITSSIGVVAFSTTIVREFIKLNKSMKSNYYYLMERQKKLDYTGNLAGSLIHEVKNTNQIIKGFANVLNKSVTMSEREISALEMIQKSSEHLWKLTNNYKEFMNASMLSLEKEDIESIIQETIDLSSEMLRENNVEIQFINDYKPLYVYVNRINLAQVFINLIKNSIEAMPPEKTQRKIIIRTELDELDDSIILIHFMDTGKGIPYENWQSVFDPFISFKKRGMGLGLPFVKKTIIEHLGDVYIVESSPKGTHFQIELPQNVLLNG